MKIVITDSGLIWNHNNPVLEVFKDILIVVCLDGKSVTDKYKCLVTPYEQLYIGQDEFGTEDLRYKALESVVDKLKQLIGYSDDVLFLTDGHPRSLYPFHVLKDTETYNRFHLCTISPFSFESDLCIHQHKMLLSDLSNLRSILYIDSNEYLKYKGKDFDIKNVYSILKEDYASLLPTVINNIRNIAEQSYFDFKFNSYVSARKGAFQIRNIRKKALETEINAKLIPEHHTLGLVVNRRYPNKDPFVIYKIENAPVRLDGKKVCNYLRKLRIALARANGIEFESKECPSIGPCAGTCEKCEEEAAYLRTCLAEIAPEKRCIPNFDLNDWEVE